MRLCKRAIVMRSYFIIIGSVSFFEKNLQELSAEGAEFNDVITLFDTVRTAGKMLQKIDSLIVRNNHYHGIVESAHARLGGLIEDVTEKDALVYIHNPTRILFHYICREYEAENCNLRLIEEPRSSLAEISDIQKKIKDVRRKIIGQDNALEQIAKTLNYLASTKRNKPYVLMLYGNSSLGKTETAKAIEDTFFGGKMIERHLSMFEDFSFANSDYLFGGKPNVNSLGYELNERESNLVFFDEMDKCGASYRSAFYSLFDNPTFLDTTYEVDISGLLIVLTCNFLTEEDIRRNLGDPIYFRIDKSIYFEDFSQNNLLKILEIEADKQLSQIVNHEDINRQQVIRLAARKIIVTESNGRTVQAAVRSTIENLLYEQEPM